MKWNKTRRSGNGGAGEGMERGEGRGERRRNEKGGVEMNYEWMKQRGPWKWETKTTVEESRNFMQ